MNSFLKRLDISFSLSELFIIDPFVESIRLTPGARNSRGIPVRLFHGWCLNVCTYGPGLSSGFLHECDAILITTSHSYEDTSLIQMKLWFKSFPQDPPVYAIGPLLPPGCSCHSVKSLTLEKSQLENDVQAFLEEMQSTHGERSVVFVSLFPCHWTNTWNILQISFGTLFWPTVPEYIDEVIQALTEKRAPFVCSPL